MQAPVLEGWLSLVEAARFAGCGRTTLDKAARGGELAYAVTPLGRVFRVEDITEWVGRRYRNDG